MAAGCAKSAGNVRQILSEVCRYATAISDMLEESIAQGGGTGMTSQPSDEDVLIRAARAERGEQRSGRSMGASLGVAIALAAVGGVLVFVPRVISVALPGRGGLV